jgi:hypothetical protein
LQHLLDVPFFKANRIEMFEITDQAAFPPNHDRWHIWYNWTFRFRFAHDFISVMNWRVVDSVCLRESMCSTKLSRCNDHMWHLDLSIHNVKGTYLNSCEFDRWYAKKR